MGQGNRAASAAALLILSHGPAQINKNAKFQNFRFGTQIPENSMTREMRCPAERGRALAFGGFLPLLRPYDYWLTGSVSYSMFLFPPGDVQRVQI
jgi:hypothetical protein